MLNSLQTQGSYGEVDDWWATFEWSSGGMVHVHIAFWIVASPRIDKVLISTEETVSDAAITLVWDEDASVVLNDDAAARVLTKFYDRVYTEWNPFKNKQEEVPAVGVRRSMGKKIEKTKPAIDMISTASIIALLETDASKPFPAEFWYECVAIFKGSCPEVVEFPAEPRQTNKNYLYGHAACVICLLGCWQHGSRCMTTMNHLHLDHRQNRKLVPKQNMSIRVWRGRNAENCSLGKWWTQVLVKF